MKRKNAASKVRCPDKLAAGNLTGTQAWQETRNEKLTKEMLIATGFVSEADVQRSRRKKSTKGSGKVKPLVNENDTMIYH